MPEYVVKHASVVLPMKDRDSAAPVAREGQVIELDEKVAEYFLDRDAIQLKADADREAKNPPETEQRVVADSQDSSLRSGDEGKPVSRRVRKDS